MTSILTQGDSPYFNCETDYGKNIFHRDDFTTLRDLLQSIQGKFILSINDVPEIRELFKEFRIEEVQTIYSIGRGGKKDKITELLIMNFKPKENIQLQVDLNFNLD